MGIIKINDLKVRALIGAYPWEKADQQELIINITLEYDAAKACQSDKLKDALNYESLSDKIVKITRSAHSALLEKLAAKLLKGIMADRRVRKAHVRVEKPHALPHARSVSFELTAVR